MTEEHRAYVALLAKALECTEDEALAVIFATFKAERRAERILREPAPMLPRDEDGRLLPEKDLEIYLGAFAGHRIEEARRALLEEQASDLDTLQTDRSLGPRKPDSVEQRAALIREIALEQILGPAIMERLAMLSKSWGGSIGETLQRLVHEAPTKAEQEQLDFYQAGIERNLSAIAQRIANTARMNERRDRIMIELAGIVRQVRGALKQTENERIFKLLGEYGTVEDIKTEREFAEVPAMIAAQRKVHVGES